MILKRRDRPRFWQRAREFFAPRKGFWRGFGYIGKRMRRLPDSPHRIALGFACGAFASFSPFFTLHFFLAAGLAWMVRGNILAALFGTIVGNPLTFPFISAMALWLGRWLMGRSDSGSNFEAITHAFAEAFNSIWATMQSWFGYGPSMLDGLLVFLDEVFLPYLIGGIIPGTICGLVCYYTIGPIVNAYQVRRRQKLEKVQAKRRAEIDAEMDAYGIEDGRGGDNA